MLQKSILAYFKSACSADSFLVSRSLIVAFIALRTSVDTYVKLPRRAVKLVISALKAFKSSVVTPVNVPKLA